MDRDDAEIDEDGGDDGKVEDGGDAGIYGYGGYGGIDGGSTNGRIGGGSMMIINGNIDGIYGYYNDGEWIWWIDIDDKCGGLDVDDDCGGLIGWNQVD